MKLRYYMRGLGIGIVVTAILLSVSLHEKARPMTDEQVIARARELGMEEKYETAVLADGLSGNSTDGMNAEDGSAKPENGKAAQTVDGGGQKPGGEAKDVRQQGGAEEEAKAADDGRQTTDADTDVAVTESTENKLAQEAQDRAEQAKKDARDAADQMTQKADGLAEDAAALKVGQDTSGDKTDAAEKNKADGKTGTADKGKDDGKNGAGGQDKADGKTDAEKTDKTPAAGKAAQITISNGDDSYKIAKKLEAMGVISDSAAFDDYLCQNGLDKRITTGKHTIKADATREEIAKELTTRVTK